MKNLERIGLLAALVILVIVSLVSEKPQVVKTKESREIDFAIELEEALQNESLDVVRQSWFINDERCSEILEGADQALKHGIPCRARVDSIENRVIISLPSSISGRSYRILVPASGKVDVVRIEHIDDEAVWGTRIDGPDFAKTYNSVQDAFRGVVSGIKTEAHFQRRLHQ